MRNSIQRYFVAITLMFFTLSVLAQSNGDQLFLQGQQYQQEKTISSQEKAIKAFKAAKIIYTNQASKQMCDNQISLCQKTIKEIKKAQQLIKPLEISRIEFNNEDANESIINPYGSKLYASDMKYLGTKAYITPKINSSKTITLGVKIYRPDGTIMQGASSPDKYTKKHTATIYNSTTSIDLGGWGNATTSIYTAGTYRYEIWYNGSKLHSEYFTINDGSGNSAFMDISSIVFGNGTSDGWINDYGEKMYASDMRYLYGKAYIKSHTNSSKTLTLDIKIIKPDGSLEQGTSSPSGYSKTRSVNIEPTTTSIDLGGWGNATTSTYTAGTYKYEIWYNGNKLHSEYFTIYKAPISISKIEFCNEDYNNNIINSYGSKLEANDMKYLGPRMYITPHISTSKSISLDIKIIKPNGTIMQGKSSPTGYTFSDKITVNNYSSSVTLKGYGNSTTSAFTAGTYQYEIWYNGNKLHSESFTIYNASAMAYMDISSVEFRNEDYDGNILSQYGNILYARNIKYLCAKINMTSLTNTSKEVTLYIKIIKPNGSLMQGSSSPTYYTRTRSVTVNSYTSSINLGGWGNNNGGVYTSGTYRYEIWYNHSLIYNTEVTLY